MSTESELDRIDSDVLAVLKSRLSRGDMMLFTGAGFSRAAVALDGQPVPGSADLKSLLWPIAFPDDDEDEKSSLADVFGCAIEQSPRRVQELFERSLRIDADSVPDSYRVWFSMPWARIYTLNVDDLDEAVQRAFTLPQPLTSVSTAHAAPSDTDRVWSVHLNGRLKDLPDITFSPLQYGKRSPGRDPWYATLIADLLSRSFVFVGTTLDEPPLWEHLELRGDRPRGRELRPRSFLVTTSLPIARRRMLQRLNITHIPMGQEEFADVLSKLTMEAEAGHQRRSARSSRSTAAQLIQSVTELRQRRTELNLPQYLLGREPDWRDISEGFAIQRSFESELLNEPVLLEPRVILITGTAGTGKSTALRRVALSLEATGQSVGWLDPSRAEVGIPRIRDDVIASGFEFVAIDDIDMFGEQAGPLLSSFAKVDKAPRVIATSRSTRAEKFDIWSKLDGIDVARIVAPSLTDDDIDGLIEVLRKAGLLGKLAGKSYREQRDAFRRQAGRQLLVAMLEATSGEKFEDKIDDECSELPHDQALVYAIVALATRYRLWLTLDEILAAVGEASPQWLQTIDAVKRQHLLVDASDGGLAVRHRVIAERATSWFRRQRQLAEPVQGLVFSMAVQYVKSHNTSARSFRILIRLMNHKFMIEEIQDRSDVRAIYEAIAPLLYDDFHFWLQRGSFETETGDLALAENYLDQARALGPDDYRVQTEWAYMSLKRAADWARTGGQGWRERADNAMADLRKVIELRGALDSYPYHVLGSQGLHFLRRAPLADSDKMQQLDMLRRVVGKGCAAHPAVDELRQLRDDLEAEYLLMATDEPVPEEEV